MNNSKIQKTVMRRIYAIRLMKLVVAPLAALAALLVALWGIGREVWVAKVLENMPALSDVPGILTFGTTAFIQTDLIVQTLSVLFIAAILWLASELAHTLKQTIRFA